MERKEKARNNYLAYKIFFIINAFSLFTQFVATAQTENDSAFDIKYHQLVKNYTWIADLIDSSKKNVAPHKIYSVSRSIYDRKIGLTAELRSTDACGGCWEYKILFLTDNKNFNYVIPYFDAYFLRKKACQEISFPNRYIFNIELNKAVDYYIDSLSSEKNIYITKEELAYFLLDEVLQEERISEGRINELINRADNWTGDAIKKKVPIHLSAKCKQTYKKNLQEIAAILTALKKDPESKNIEYFSVNHSIFSLMQVSINQNNNIEIKYINPDCYCFPVY